MPSYSQVLLTRNINFVIEFSLSFFPVIVGLDMIYIQGNKIAKYRLQQLAVGKRKAVSLQAWSDPEASRKGQFPDFMSTAQDGGKIVSLEHRPPLPPGNTPGTHFC